MLVGFGTTRQHRSKPHRIPCGFALEIIFDLVSALAGKDFLKSRIEFVLGTSLFCC